MHRTAGAGVEEQLELDRREADRRAEQSVAEYAPEARNVEVPRLLGVDLSPSFVSLLNDMLLRWAANQPSAQGADATWAEQPAGGEQSPTPELNEHTQCSERSLGDALTIAESKGQPFALVIFDLGNADFNSPRQIKYRDFCLRVRAWSSRVPILLIGSPDDDSVNPNACGLQANTSVFYVPDSAVSGQQAEQALHLLLANWQLRQDKSQYVRNLYATTVRLRNEAKHRRSAENKRLHEQTHDPLTGLPNKKQFHDELAKTLLEAESRQLDNRATPSVGLVRIEVDDFQSIALGVGYSAAGELSRQIAHRVRAHLHTNESLASYGERGLILQIDGLPNAESLMRRARDIQGSFSEPFPCDENTLYLSVSGGTCFIDTFDSPYPTELLRDVDTALTMALTQGPNGLCAFDPSAHKSAMTRWEVRTDLLRSIIHEQFELHFQPLVNLYDNSLVGFESLIRWKHPEKGQIAPDDFIPIAEQSGLITQLGQWIIEDAIRCQSLLERSAGRPVTVSVNVSFVQLDQGNVPNDLANALTLYNCPADRIKLEITERVMTTSPERSLKALQRIRKMGVQVYLDDFGTGYSSLSQVLQLPINALKIDRSFTEAVRKNPDDSAIITMIVNLADSLQVDVIAEGIETSEDATRLLQLGCPVGQGYYFARPQPIHNAITTCKTWCPESFGSRQRNCA